MRPGIVFTSALFCVGTAFAQQVTAVDKLPAAVNGFDSSSDRGSLSCTVEPVKPAFNFAFRFQTGYRVRTSLDPYVGARHHWYIALRVTPEAAGRRPVYFLDSIDLPAPPNGSFVADESGTFLVGEGRYEIKWILVDDLGRVCRQEWRIDAHLSEGERSLKVAMPPGSVGKSLVAAGGNHGCAWCEATPRYDTAQRCAARRPHRFILRSMADAARHHHICAGANVWRHGSSGGV